MATMTAILDSKITVLSILSLHAVWWPKLDIGTECFIFCSCFLHFFNSLAPSFGSMTYGFCSRFICFEMAAITTILNVGTE